jgi:microcystin-dependent protein
MSSPFLGQINIFGFNFAPQGWAFCNGQVLPISQNTALFAILGTTYGGNGTSTFALPNLQGAVPLGFGQGTGLSNYSLGQSGGAASVSLNVGQLPSHSHAAECQTGSGDESPSNAVWGTGGRGKPPAYAATSTPTAVMNATALSATGGNGAHNNLSPYLALSFCIALQGIFPSRN